jgi:hypothetical protein
VLKYTSAERQYERVGTALGILRVVLDGNVPPREKMQRKVDAGEEHENDRDETDRIAVEIADAEIVCGETADGDRGEGVAQGVRSCPPTCSQPDS